MTPEETQFINEKRKTGELITDADLEGYARLVAEITDVTLDEVRFLGKRHVQTIEGILKIFGRGKQSGRSFAEVVKLFFGIGSEKMSVADIAQQYGVTPPAIRVDIHRVLRRLKRHSREFSHMIAEKS